MTTTDPDGPHAEMRNVINEMYCSGDMLPEGSPMRAHLHRWAEVTERYTALPDFPERRGSSASTGGDQ